MSFGMRSGVHWMRWNEPSTAAASVCAAVVLARPGTDSSRMCPPASSVLTSAVRRASCPTTRWSKTWPTRLSRWLARSRSCVEMLPCPAAIGRPPGGAGGVVPCAAGGRTEPREPPANPAQYASADPAGPGVVHRSGWGEVPTCGAPGMPHGPATVAPA
ncbi:Uncharacterised protein [Mycobacteroides abscessus]|nr:Uncharacterised protein [Mycobacteroides abscessus]